MKPEDKPRLDLVATSLRRLQAGNEIMREDRVLGFLGGCSVLRFPQLGMNFTCQIELMYKSSDKFNPAVSKHQGWNVAPCNRHAVTCLSHSAGDHYGQVTHVQGVKNFRSPTFTVLKACKSAKNYWLEDIDWHLLSPRPIDWLTLTLPRKSPIRISTRRPLGFFDAPQIRNPPSKSRKAPCQYHGWASRKVHKPHHWSQCKA